MNFRERISEKNMVILEGRLARGVDYDLKNTEEDMISGQGKTTQIVWNGNVGTHKN